MLRSGFAGSDTAIGHQPVLAETIAGVPPESPTVTADSGNWSWLRWHWPRQPAMWRPSLYYSPGLLHGGGYQELFASFSCKTVPRHGPGGRYRQCPLIAAFRAVTLGLLVGRA